MAVYPAGNPGVYPLDATTDIGGVRLASGDTQSKAYDPVESGYQNYTFMSDDEITQFLSMSGDSIPGAVGYWYLQLSGAAARAAKNIGDYDLKVSTEKRAADLRATAEFWFGMAGISVTGGEYFDIVQTGEDPLCWPELAERPVWWP